MTDQPDAATSTADRAPVPTDRLSGAVEALLLLADEPLSALQLATTLRVPVDEVAHILGELAAFYDDTGRGFELRHVAGGWRYYTRPAYADVIADSVLEGQQARLSQAALETLAVIAYLQPVSRSRVSAVRGVSVDRVVRTLLARELVAETGHDDATGAALLTTTSEFLVTLGLSDLGDLPPLAPHLPEASALEAELAGLAQPPASTEPADARPATVESGAAAPKEFHDDLSE